MPHSHAIQEKCCLLKSFGSSSSTTRYYLDSQVIYFNDRKAVVYCIMYRICANVFNCLVFVLTLMCAFGRCVLQLSAGQAIQELRYATERFSVCVCVQTVHVFLNGCIYESVCATDIWFLSPCCTVIITVCGPVVIVTIAINLV